MSTPVRRIVTGHDKNGKAVIRMDTPAPNARVRSSSGLTSTLLWVEDGTPADNAGQADKADREHQSHAIVLRLRKLLEPMNRGAARIKVVEVPPGPPVLSTLVAEIHAEPLTPYAVQRQAPAVVPDRLAAAQAR